MVWIIITIVSIVILIIVVKLYSKQRGRQSANQKTITTENINRPSNEIDTSLSTIDDTDIESGRIDSEEKASHPTLLKDRHRQRQQLSPDVTPYKHDEEKTRTYVRHDRQKLFEESIHTLFPEEWSEAIPYLRQAYKLEKEGTDPEKVKSLLVKANQIDSRAAVFYLTRLSIMKKKQQG